MADSSTADPVYQSVRPVAARVLMGVVQGASLTRLIADYSERVKPRDQALLAEMCYGSCRWYHRLDTILAWLLKKPLRKRDADIHALLIIGLYQLEQMRIKPHAVLSETVNASRQLGKPMFSRLVNGVLRQYQRDQQKLSDRADHQDVPLYSMPRWLLDDIRSSWPQDWQKICQAMLSQPPMTLRLNTRCLSQQEYAGLLVKEQMQASPVKGIPTALVLDRAQAVDKIPGFRQGLVSVQDAGAQLAAMLLDAAPGSDVLDACAAPGGKTGHLLERAGTLQLTAIDVDRQRLQKVSENLQRLGLHATIAVGDASTDNGEWAHRLYDYILLDVPCSATGVIRRHPDIKLLRKKNDIAKLVQLQRQILLNIWPRLKQGGRMLYATCSLLSAENEQQIDWFLKQQQDVVELSLQPAVEHQRKLHGIQVLPGNLNMDGFYYSLLEKRQHA